MSRHISRGMMLAALGVAATFGGAGCDTRGTSTVKPTAEVAGKCYQTISEGGKTTQKEIACPGGGGTSSAATPATPATTYGPPAPNSGSGGTTTPSSTTTPTPTPAPAVAGQATFASTSGSGGSITISGYQKANIAGPYETGQDQNTIWAGLQLPTNQVGSVRPALAGDYLGSPGWSIGSIINVNLLGTYQGDNTSGTLTVKSPVANDNGQGVNIAHFRWNGSNWVMASWNNSAPPIPNNFATFYDPNSKFYIVDYQARRSR